MQAERECERLIFAIVHYIGDAAGLPNYTQLIKENLPALFQVVVIPNISLTEQDLEEYECEPQTYIKNDLEESDTETRRRHCMKFVQSLAKKFNAETSELIG